MLTKKTESGRGYEGREPADRFVKQYEAFAMMMKTPITRIKPPIGGRGQDMNGVSRSFGRKVSSALSLYTTRSIKSLRTSRSGVIRSRRRTFNTLWRRGRRLSPPPRRSIATINM